MNKNHVAKIIESHGFTDYQWLIPQRDIIVAHWVRFHCLFGCSDYGQFGSCPPAVPSIDECRKMIHEYKNALILHFSIRLQPKEEKHQMMSDLLALEREVFLAGYYKAFLMPHSSCVFCKNCVAEDSRMKCVDKVRSRPSPDAMGIDVFQTARNAGYLVEVVTDHESMTNRFSFLLVD